MPSTLSFSSASLNPYYHLFFTILALFISGLIFLLSRKSKSKPLHLPPGPPGWPIVGNLFQVAQSGKPFFEYVDDLHSKYGPKKTPTRTIFSCNKFSVNAAVYGSVWRSLRRNMVQNMLSSSRIKEFRGVRDSAMDTLIDRLRTEAEANSGAVWVIANVRFAVFCILLTMCFGIEMDDETIEKMDQECCPKPWIRQIGDVIFIPGYPF
ncbi:hypothetical protein OIU85_006796 [Salix viminalis]|uniref:Cytochrome P450 n=1 Tax=Salix viminalis TaxID=40686 RepID=A0A9Q0PLY9_SALVM|nr:hypothetical protein OIU85_006796 [Salix viminalis]